MMDKTASDFIARIAHDMRSPLMVIKTFLEALSAETIDPELREIHQVSIQSVEKLNAMVDQLRSPVSIQQPKRQWVDIAQVVKASVNLVAPLAQKRNAEVFYSGPDHLVCHVDSELIDRVIGNLMVNAIQALREDHDGMIRVGLFLAEDTVFVEVGDNGKGIAAEHLVKIFEPGFTYGKKDGTGIGLDTCKQIIEGHSGEIKVYSIPGRGTVFTSTLPQPASLKEHKENEQAPAAEVREDTLD